jgi:hypothetical protein
MMAAAMRPTPARANLLAFVTGRSAWFEVSAAPGDPADTASAYRSFRWHLYPVGAAYPPAAPVMEDSTVPWAWGVNGIFSVLSPVVSIAFCMIWGVGALLLAAVPVYLAAAAALPAPAVARPEPSGSEALLEARP